MKTRMLTGSEMLLAHCLWGPGLYPTLRRTKIINERFSREFIDELVDYYGFQPPPADQVPVEGAVLTLVDDKATFAFIFCPEGAGPAVLMHEFGHAVQARTGILIADKALEQRLPEDEARESSAGPSPRPRPPQAGHWNNAPPRPG